MPEYKTLAEWQARRAQLREQILAAAGLSPMPEKTPLNAQLFGKLERKGYTIEKVLLETLPGFYLGGNLYRPIGRSGRLPGVLKAHGHWAYGRLEHQPNGEMQTLCANLALQGYVVFAYDMVGYNDTPPAEHRFGGQREKLWSFGPLGLQLWNSVRALDFLQSLPDVDPERIAMTGASGGGTQTFLLAAVDDRVKWAAPVNMISAIMQGGCVCENAPGLRLGANNMEIGAMMAPRPLLMVSATGDWTRNTPHEEYPAIRRIYELYGKADDVETVQFDAPHNYNRSSREAMYQFFARRIMGQTQPGQPIELAQHPELPQDLLALHGRARSANAVDYDQLFAYWRKVSESQTRAMDNDTLRRHLARSAFVEWPDSASGEPVPHGLVLGRPGKGDRVPAVWIDGKGMPALVVHPEGTQAARASLEVKRLLEAGRPALLIDAFQTGSAAASRDRSHQHFLTFNLSDDASRLQDILTALAYLHGRQSGRIELIGVGKAAEWVQFAAALAPVPIQLTAPLGAFRGTDDELIRDFFVPGLQRGGGLETARRLTSAAGR